MTDTDQAPATGDILFEAFIEQIKQVLEHLYDFAYLQQHALARVYDNEGDLSAKTAGRQLRYELVTAIESLKPNPEVQFRALNARLYDILHLYYIENQSVQQVADELGLSERQAYRDLKRGQESVASVLWNNRLPPAQEIEPLASDFSLESEVARLKLHVRPVDVGAIFSEARSAVERLAALHHVTLSATLPSEAMRLSTDPVLAHQILVSVLSYAVQEARVGELAASFEVGHDLLTLKLDYRVEDMGDSKLAVDAIIPKLAERLKWTIGLNDSADQYRHVTLRMASSHTTVMVIDDNEGWGELLNRFLQGFDCLVVSTRGDTESLQRAEELNPSAIILDVMMPDKDGWEILQRLRAMPVIAKVPIIVCSVFNDPQLAYSLGASAFVSKPTDQKIILETLKELGVI
jgi:CheY-like chemotaxis protein